MARIIGFIDGFNVYHALLKDARLNKYRWINYWKLIESFARQDETVEDVFLFTAFTNWDKRKKARHRILVAAQRHFEVKIVFGQFSKITRKCRKCGNKYETMEEKRSDVNIAVEVVKQAVLGTYDKAVIVSADSDLIPAIQAARSINPSLEFAVVTPINLRSKALSNSANYTLRMERRHLNKAEMIDEIILADGSKLSRPSSWR